MYNIIRGMPLFITDKQGKMQFFIGGRCVLNMSNCRGAVLLPVCLLLHICWQVLATCESRTHTQYISPFSTAAHRSGQLGAEGFIVGSGYVLFSLSIALFAHGAPKVKHPITRSSVAFLLVGVSAFLAYQIWMVYGSKTGYKVSSYLLP